MATWNTATELEVPRCTTCNGERIVRKTFGGYKPCPTCAQRLDSVPKNIPNPFNNDDTSTATSTGDLSFRERFNQTLRDDEMSKLPDNED